MEAPNGQCRSTDTAEALRAAFEHARWLQQDTGRMLAEARCTLAVARRLLAECNGYADVAQAVPLAG